MIKRLFDVLVSVTALVVLSPVILLSMILAYINDGSPIFFSQRRPGRNGRIFTIYKLRTMSTNESREEADRISRIGSFLRKSSIDELPELWNILKGDMSIVGPRPLLEKYLPLYNDRQKKRHLVRPGLTGLAQVNGRNAVSWEDRLDMDVVYAENNSFWLDLKIIFKTIQVVVFASNINKSNSETMNEFKGTPSGE